MSWQKGPLPPNTWNWGGVVPKGLTGGFHFADFKGDHVVTVHDNKRIEPEDVEWFNNGLNLPPGVFGTRL